MVHRCIENWDLNFLRLPNNWEEEDSCAQLELLSSMQIDPDGEDDILAKNHR